MLLTSTEVSYLQHPQKCFSKPMISSWSSKFYQEVEQVCTRHVLLSFTTPSLTLRIIFTRISQTVRPSALQLTSLWMKVWVEGPERSLLVRLVRFVVFSFSGRKDFSSLIYRLDSCLEIIWKAEPFNFYLSWPAWQILSWFFRGVLRSFISMYISSSFFLLSRLGLADPAFSLNSSYSPSPSSSEFWQTSSTMEYTSLFSSMVRLSLQWKYLVTKQKSANMTMERTRKTAIALPMSIKIIIYRQLYSPPIVAVQGI